MPLTQRFIGEIGLGATGSHITTQSFSFENLPGLYATGFIGQSMMVNYLDPNSSSGPPEAICGFNEWQTANGGIASPAPGWGGFFSADQVTRVEYGATCIQSMARWTVIVDCWQ